MSGTQRAIRPALLVSGQRAGGTFLACCLSNHPDIFCPRCEPFNSRDVWRLCEGDRNRIEIVLHQQHYKVSMCKMFAQNALGGDVRRYIVQNNVRLIVLERENLVDQALSCVINLSRQAYGHPAHTFVPMGLEPVILQPREVHEAITYNVESNQAVKMFVKQFGLSALWITYEQMTNDCQTPEVAQAAAERICRFLEVPCRRLWTDMRKVHAGGVRETVANWEEVADYLSSTEYRKYL